MYNYLEGTHYFGCQVKDPTSYDAPIAADSAPQFAVYENGYGTAVKTGSMTAGPNTGDYYGTFTRDAASGFEKGKCYRIRVEAIVGTRHGVMEEWFEVDYDPLDLSVNAVANMSTFFDNGGNASTVIVSTVGPAAFNAVASSYNTAGTIGAKINSAATAGDPWSTTIPGSYAAGTAGYILGTNLNATVTSRQATGSVSIASGGITSASFATDAISAAALASAAVAKVWTTQLTESYAVDGVAPTAAQLQFMQWSLAAEPTLVSTTLTAKKLDGTTTAMTFTTNDATTPTAMTRTT